VNTKFWAGGILEGKSHIINNDMHKNIKMGLKGTGCEGIDQ